MKRIQYIAFLLLTMGMSTMSYAQKTSTIAVGSGNLLGITDKEVDKKIKELEAKIKKCDEAITAQEKKRGQRYREVSIDVQYELNMREDSIYLSMCSEKTALQLQVRDMKRDSLRKLVGNIMMPNKTTPDKTTPDKPTPGKVAPGKK